MARTRFNIPQNRPEPLQKRSSPSISARSGLLADWWQAVARCSQITGQLTGAGPTQPVLYLPLVEALTGTPKACQLTPNPSLVVIATARAVGGPLRRPKGTLVALGQLFRDTSCLGSARGRDGARLGWGAP